MLDVHLSYKPPSSWRILFRSAGFPTPSSCLKKFSALVVPGGGCRRGVILQGFQLKRRLSCGRRSCLRRKGGVTVVSVYAPRQRNSLYVQMVRRSIYETRRPEHPHSKIRLSTMTPRDPRFTAPLQGAKKVREQ